MGQEGIVGPLSVVVDVLRIDCETFTPFSFKKRKMAHPPACTVCGQPVVAAKNHDIPAARAATMFPRVWCNCGKRARVRCFNGAGTFWIECEDGHGVERPA